MCMFDSSLVLLPAAFMSLCKKSPVSVTYIMQINMCTCVYVCYECVRVCTCVYVCVFFLSLQVELEPVEPKEEPPLPQATALSGEHIIAEANLSLEEEDDDDDDEIETEEPGSNALMQTPSQLPLSPPPEPPIAPAAPVAVAASKKKSLEFSKGGNGFYFYF